MEISVLEDRLKMDLGTKVKIICKAVRGNVKGQINISFSDESEMERVINLLHKAGTGENIVKESSSAQ